MAGAGVGVLNQGPTDTSHKISVDKFREGGKHEFDWEEITYLFSLNSNLAFLFIYEYTGNKPQQYYQHL